MKKVKKVLAVALVAAMVFGLSACGSSSSSSSTTKSSSSAATSSTKSTSNMKIEVILKTLASEYWSYVQAGAVAAGKELGVSVDVVGASSETSFDEQMSMIETALGSSEYSAITIAPLQPDMVATKIADTNIPILAVDTKIPSDKVKTFIGTGNEAAAKTGGEYAAKQLIASGVSAPTAVCISGVQGDTTAEARLSGYKAGFEGAGGKILEVQYADAVADKAVTVMEGFLQKYDHIDAVLCNNDDMAMAAARAASDAGKATGTEFVGFDGISSACKAILAGQETFSVAQDPYQMGYKAVELAIKAANGEKLDDFYDTGVEMITKDNAQARLDKMNGYLGK